MLGSGAVLCAYGYCLLSWQPVPSCSRHFVMSYPATVEGPLTDYQVPQSDCLWTGKCTDFLEPGK